MFDPADLFTRQPFSTCQLEAFAGLSKAHPWKSRPLKRAMGAFHLALLRGFSAGARFPVQVQGVSLGPLAEPARVSPVSLPSKMRSVRLSSSSLGETNSIWSPWIATLGNGRAFP